MRRWHRKSVLLLLLSLGIAGIVWSQMGMYLVHLLFGVDVKVNFFKFCMSLFHEDSLYYFLIITFLNAIIAYTMLVTAVKLVKQYMGSRKMKARLLALREIKQTAWLIERFRPANQHVIVIRHTQPLAFTVGLRRPLVVLSSAMVDMLGDGELEAVVHHEIYHQQSYDTLKIFALQLVAQSLWFIPLFRWSLRNYSIMSELMADEFAVQQTGSEHGLGSALLKLIKNAFSDNPTPVLVRFTDGVVNYRLQQLVEPSDGIPVKADFISVILSVSVLFMFMAMIVLAIA
jgi:Zn-dependent protease with chaperone function